MAALAVRRPLKVDVTQLLDHVYDVVKWTEKQDICPDHDPNYPKNNQRLSNH